MVISNLGSIKLKCGYHHLTNWGTCSLFCIIGEKKKSPFFDESGQVSMRETLELGLSIDARIAEKAGCSIPEIFAKGGEAAFRALEREATAACGALSGKLLLTGGGVVKTPENYAALHQNGRIYQLLRPLELLPTDGRPLSQGADLAAMWAERAPLYDRFRDAALVNSGTVEQTAQAIWRDFCENSGH